ncbi:MAG: HlyD family secretion protein [Chitinophagales bacterium]
MSEAGIATAQEELQPNGKRKTIQIVVLLLFVVGACVGGFLWWKDLKTSITTDNAKVSGDIVDISPKISGRLEQLRIEEGQYVNAGQIVAQLDNAQYKINVEQTRAALDLATANYKKLPNDIKSLQASVDKAQQTMVAYQASVKAAKITLSDAQRVLKENEGLFKEGAISKEALESYRSKYVGAQASLEAAEANVASAAAGLRDSQAKLDSTNNTGAEIYLAQMKQAQAAYDNAVLTLNNSIIKTPISGNVVRLAVQVGENVSAGQTVITVSDLDKTWVTANIEEKKIGRIKVGQDVDVTVDSYPGIKFPGQVVEVGDATQATFALIPTENTSGNYTKVSQRLSVKIEVDRKDQVLKPGMSAVVKIHTVK